MHGLRKITTADTIYFPYGTKLKMGRFMPFARLSMSDYAGEIGKIDPNVMPNEELPEAREDEVAFDITEHLLKIESISHLKQLID